MRCPTCNVKCDVLTVTGQGTSMVARAACPSCRKSYRRRYTKRNLATAAGRALDAAALELTACDAST